MRISGGAAKGRRIPYKKASARGKDEERLRPTSSKVREAIFDILRDRIDGSSFVDLYAGSGSVGIEALSRGAKKVTFVETNILRIRIIEQLLSEFGFKEKAEIIRSKAYDFIEREARRGGSYDIIFLDPPYQSEELMKVLPLIGRTRVLKDNGVVVAEHFSKRTLPDNIEGLTMVRSYRYGDTALTVYRSGAGDG
jgi:16S rRNA (guanine(966)-N(2))-methyltransferase RsmD